MIRLPDETEPAVVVQGDAHAVALQLPDATFDAVITDPPYSSGGAFRGDRQVSTEVKYSGWSHQNQNESGISRTPVANYPAFTGDTRDQRSYLTWFSLWAEECLRACKPGAHFLTFTDWRQLPTMTDAVQVAGWVWRGVAVWDKGIGRPQKGRFRNHIEYIVWATNGPVGDAQDVYLPSLFRYSAPTASTRQHRTEKPVELIKELLRLTPPDALILDPFGGSGTTAAASLETGRRCLLIEKEPAYVDIARRRIAAARAESPLYAGADR